MNTKFVTSACLFVLLIVLTTACGDTTTSPAAQGASASAGRTALGTQTHPADARSQTPMNLRDAPLECPVEQAICDRANSFRDILNDGGNAVAQAATPVKVTCPPTGVSAGLNPLCTDANVGAIVTGFSVGIKKLTLVDRNGLAQAINLMTEPVLSKGWGFHVMSIGCPQPGATPDCSVFFAAAYMGALGSPGSHTQQVIIIAFKRDGANARPMAFLNQQYDPEVHIGGWCDAIYGGSCAFNFGNAPVKSSPMPGEVPMLPWAPDKLS